MTTGDYVQRWREDRGWFQRELAKRLGWDQAKVSRVERGVVQPSLRDLKSLARVFAQPLDLVLRIGSRAA